MEVKSGHSLFSASTFASSALVNVPRGLTHSAAATIGEIGEINHPVDPQRVRGPPQCLGRGGSTTSDPAMLRALSQ